MPKALKLLERILATIPLMVVLIILVFVFVRMIPGDPVDIMMGQAGNVTEAEIAAIRRDLGLDQPLGTQLQSFLSGLLKGDLGYSFRERQPVADLLGRTFPATVELALAALGFALLLGLPIGIISAVRQNSLTDRLAMAGSFFGISMPAFWAGIMGILLFGVYWKWLPPGGRIDLSIPFEPVTGFYLYDSLVAGNWPAFRSALRHLILPGMVLGLELTAIVARVMRSSMLQSLRQDYIQFARAKGVAGAAVVVHHAVPNALIPTVTVVGLQAGVLLGGNMIIETIFSWPGLGRLVVEAIFSRDYAVVQGAVLLYAVTFVVANLLVDLVYTYLNPKITL